ncbi:hypothetical protein BGW38_007499 [Lunasporangiospora selenospora]|uniref:Uncharacterized protein n=1 Tax=Lunasporangiospora selenospora TaxID=979761 RepID=A0A9P6FMB6_9FUNG|nr:hypothetical protein BGW38_007499 [Lunasporangiospora selenospora]
MWKGSCNPGQLTPKGALQHRQLGAALRRIYVDELGFLSKSFHPERTYIRSTDLWRTRQSAENLMVGLYGSQKHGLWGSPIPPLFTIHTLPTEIDYLTMNGEACPRIQQLRAAAEKASPVLKRLHEEEAEFEEELQGILGAKRTWSGYMDTVLPRVCHGIPLQCRATEAGARPHCITMNMADRILKNVATQSAEVYRDMTGMFEILQLGMGPLAKDIRKNLLNAQNEDDLKFKLYSGHDTTLAPLLGLLDGADMRWPPYASNLLIELWSSHGEYFVRVIYNQEFVKTQSDWCDLEWCPLDKFVAYLGKFVLDDLTEKCLKK